jgi:hypothetical protein
VPVSANTVTLTPRFSAVRYAVWPPLFSYVAPLLPKVLEFAFFLSASLFFLYSDNKAIASSFSVCGQSDKKCPLVTGSVLAAEIIGFVTAFYMASALRDVPEEIYQQSIPLYGLTDSYSFFSTGTQYNALREKRLSVEVAVVRGAYAKFELANLGFVRTAYNL